MVQQLRGGHLLFLLDLVRLYEVVLRVTSCSSDRIKSSGFVPFVDNCGSAPPCILKAPWLAEGIPVCAKQAWQSSLAWDLGHKGAWSCFLRVPIPRASSQPVLKSMMFSL